MTFVLVLLELTWCLNISTNLIYLQLYTWRKNRVEFLYWTLCSSNLRKHHEADGPDYFNILSWPKLTQVLDRGQICKKQLLRPSMVNGQTSAHQCIGLRVWCSMVGLAPGPDHHSWPLPCAQDKHLHCSQKKWKQVCKESEYKFSLYIGDACKMPTCR